MLRVQGQNLQGVHWSVMEEVARTLPQCSALYMKKCSSKQLWMEDLKKNVTPTMPWGKPSKLKKLIKRDVSSCKQPLETRNTCVCGLVPSDAIFPSAPGLRASQSCSYHSCRRTIVVLEQAEQGKHKWRAFFHLCHSAESRLPRSLKKTVTVSHCAASKEVGWGWTRPLHSSDDQRPRCILLHVGLTRSVTEDLTHTKMAKLQDPTRHKGWMRMCGIRLHNQPYPGSREKKKICSCSESLRIDSFLLKDSVLLSFMFWCEMLKCREAWNGCQIY